MSLIKISGTNESGKRRTKHAHLLPYPDFPLSAHPATRRWYRVIRGRRHCFGSLDNPQAALDESLRDYLYSGRNPPASGEGLTLRDTCNAFLTAKQQAMDARQLTRKTFRDYHRPCEKMIKTFGRERLISDLTPEDFASLKVALAKVEAPSPCPTRSSEFEPSSSGQGTRTH